MCTQEEIDHLYSLLTIKRARRSYLLQQKAFHGPNTPADVSMEIDTLGTEIGEIKAKLRKCGEGDVDNYIDKPEPGLSARVGFPPRDRPAPLRIIDMGSVIQFSRFALDHVLHHPE